MNDNYLIAPWAQVNYFADARWWQWHTDGIAKFWPWVSFTAEQQRAAFSSFAGQKVSIFNTGLQIADPCVFLLRNSGREGLSLDPGGLHTGANSGYQAVNLAVLAGAKRILLVGYDMRYSAGKAHSHNGHPLVMPEAAYSQYAKKFSTMNPQLAKLGVEVINCTPGSAVTAFRKEELASALSHS